MPAVLAGRTGFAAGEVVGPRPAGPTIAATVRATARGAGAAAVEAFRSGFARAAAQTAAAADRLRVPRLAGAIRRAAAIRARLAGAGAGGSGAGFLAGRVVPAGIEAVDTDPAIRTRLRGADALAVDAGVTGIADVANIASATGFRGIPRQAGPGISRLVGAAAGRARIEGAQAAAIDALLAAGTGDPGAAAAALEADLVGGAGRARHAARAADLVLISALTGAVRRATTVRAALGVADARAIDAGLTGGTGPAGAATCAAVLG